MECAVGASVKANYPTARQFRPANDGDQTNPVQQDGSRADALRTDPKFLAIIERVKYPRRR
jgi:hypothetical protein